MMMQILLIRIGVLIAFALAYMLFDLFNNRNVPSAFAYATLAVGILFTVLYFNFQTIAYSGLIAIAVFGFGYAVYRIGQLGMADVIEFAALSLIIPFMAKPLVYGPIQNYMPFALALVINSGVAALIVVPLYYIPKSKGIKLARMDGHKKVKKHFKVALILTIYAFFGVFLHFVVGASNASLILLAIIALGSGLVLMYEERMMAYMVQKVNYKGMEDGDIIATNMMGKRELSDAKKRIKNFERLANRKLILEIKKKMPTHRFPVYKKGIPFAVPILIGAISAIAFGNVLLLLLPTYA